MVLCPVLLSWVTKRLLSLPESRLPPMMRAAITYTLPGSVMLGLRSAGTDDICCRWSTVSLICNVHDQIGLIAGEDVVLPCLLLSSPSPEKDLRGWCIVIFLGWLLMFRIGWSGPPLSYFQIGLLHVCARARTCLDSPSAGDLLIGAHAMRAGMLSWLGYLSSAEALAITRSVESESYSIFFE
jgi:hypothetical protein